MAMQPLICRSAAMREVARRIERAAQADSPVLIWGEEGVGKKMVATTIHNRSRRRDRPMLVVPTAHEPERDMEEELFGSAEHAGRLADAAGGTLLIDEIAGLPLTVQARLLHATETRYVAGARHAIGRPVDFRLKATTCREPAKCVERRVLRRDLYYRLAVITIRVPALRERREDIPALVRRLIAEVCAVRNRPAPAVDPALMQYFIESPWPGNGRQLRECIEAAIEDDGSTVLTKDRLASCFLQEAGDPGPATWDETIDTLNDLQRQAVLHALAARDGNRTQAARALGISVRTLQRKLRQWGM